MRILFNLRTVKPGKTLGVAHYCINLIKELRKLNKVELHVLVDPGAKQDYESIFDKFIVKTRQDIRNNISYTESRCGISNYKYNIEILAHHFQEAENLAEFIAVIVHDLHIFDVAWKYRDRDLFLNKFQNNLNTASFVFTPWIRPYYLLSDYFPNVNNLSDKIFFINCPVLLQYDVLNYELINHYKNKYNFSDKTDIILYPAQLQRHKNHIVLIKAIELIDNHDLILICPGSVQDEDYRNELIEIVSNKGLSLRVIFPGYVHNNELYYLYSSSSLVISPSLAEGGNAIALEAIYFEKPIICADTEPTRMQMKLLGANFPVFPPNEPEILMSLIRNILDDRKNYVLKNQSAKEYLYSISWSSIANTVYKQLTK